MKKLSPFFEADLYEAISLRACVERRLTFGAPGKGAMEAVIAQNRKYLEEEWA